MLLTDIADIVGFELGNGCRVGKDGIKGEKSLWIIMVKIGLGNIGKEQ